MKTRNILFFLVGLFMFSSCQDMFEPMDENTRQEDAMYTESEYAYGLLMYAYNQLPYFQSTTTDVATDDAVTNELNSRYLTMASGTWASDKDPMTQWDNCRSGIQYVNKFLSIIEKVGWAPPIGSQTNQMFVDRMRGESLVLRAIFHYYLLMAHAGYVGDQLLGVPVLTEAEDASSDFNRARAPFSECIDQIFKDCDAAQELLPDDYRDLTSNEEVPAKYGDVHFTVYNRVFGLDSRNRISRKVALAVKAQAALLAISPAYSAQSNVTVDKAAEYCADALYTIEGLFGFDQNGNLDWYSSKYENEMSSTLPEVLWRWNRDEDNNQEKDFFPPTLYGSAKVNPSQNLVDAFPMNNGLPIDDPASGYDENNPYKNRDPRLANTVIYHGMKYKTKEVMIGVEMPNYAGYYDDNIGKIAKSTRTGYYLKKLLREDCSADPSSPAKKKHIYNRIRWTEIFLAFAEACNEANGPTGHAKIKEPGGTTYVDFNLSAYEVIKAIRERAGIGVDLPGGDKYIEKAKADKNLMRELIRNERRLELCFENKRFYDLRRWQDPKINEAVTGMQIEADPNDATKLKYTKIHVEDRNFKHKDGSSQWYGPIPRTETLKWSNLLQNNGWQ